MLVSLAALVCLILVDRAAGGAASSQPAEVATSAQAPEKAAHPLKASMVSECGSVVPGGTVWLGVVVEMEPGWHTYWPGENDTGAPIRLKWTVPEGWKVGEVQWPAPERHVGDGDLLDYVLEGRQVLMVPLTAPAAGKAGDLADVQLDIGWLVCKTTCIPGGAVLHASVSVAGSPGAPDTARQAVFAGARARLPRPLPEHGPVSVEWKGDRVVFDAPGATSLAFSVGLGSVLVPEPIKSGRAEGERLKLPLDLSDTERRALRGVLEVQPSGGKAPMFFAVDIPKPAPSPAR